jgi:3'-phosphoadenosine 5'-phosphosulfate sulfotransferase (PAPS reductase)/FAD synthetase
MAQHNYDRSVGKKPTSDYPQEKLDRSMAILTEFAMEQPKVVIAFSGGKDSIVAAHLARRVGIRDAVCETCFCFPQQVKDFKASAEQLGLAATYYESLSWEWLAKNPRWCMGTIKEAGQFYALRQQRTIKRHALQHGYDGVVYGRRTEENTVKAPIYQTADGLWHCHPIRDWTTAEVWAYIRKNELLYPSIYDHIIGKTEGNTPINRLPPEHFPDPWPVIHSYDPTMVTRFAVFNDDAKAFLEGTK